MTTSFTRCGLNKPRLPAHAAGRLTAYICNDRGRLSGLSWNGQTIR